MAVVVYIYSGGHDFGAIEDYTPEYILEEADIIYVAIQYRLNMFGEFTLLCLGGDILMDTINYCLLSGIALSLILSKWHYNM